MAHFKRKPQTQRIGKIVYGKGIVEDIVIIALQDVPYVELYSVNSIKKPQADAVQVNFTKDGLIIDVNVKIHFTQSVSDVVFNIQEIIRREVESMTEYKISEVNVNVSDVTFDIKNNIASHQEDDQDNAVSEANKDIKEAVSTDIKEDVKG